MAFSKQSLAIFCCIAAFSTGCSEGGDANAAAAKAGLKPGGGGGDSAIQKNLQDPAPLGEMELDVETIANGLVNPWSLEFLPDGTMLVTERPGTIRIIRDGELLETPVANAPDTYVFNQAGYFDVMAHPNFAENNVLFLAYAHGTANENALRVARATFDGAALNDLEVIYEAKPLKDTGHHYGGRIVWGPDDKLYFTVGEGSKYKEKAQDMTSSFGAVIRLNEDGSVPDDNPDFGEGSLPELYSKGHRNPQGLAYDAGRDIIWENEHGPRGGDELNIIEAGKNYGWPAATYGIDYNGARVTPFTEYEGTVQPAKYWTPSIAPSGLAVYEGDLFEGWQGDLLIGAMSGQYGRALHRIRVVDGKPAGEERYLTDPGVRIRDVRVGPDGAIYLATEDRGGEPVGKILRVTPK